ncbi:PASTA domain-containing protein [Gemmatimonadota bacterium]
MKLGGSIRRRRAGGKKKAAGSKKEKVGGVGGRLSFLLNPRVLWTFGALSVLGFGGGYLASTRVLFPAPPPPGDLVPVPDLSGASLPEASGSLAAAGLVLGSVDSLNHPAQRVGRILGQSPLPGQLSLVGDTVWVAMSTGPESRPVPDVLRLRADRAQVVLEASGFRVFVDSVASPIPRGGVVGMDPEPGTEAMVPQEIRLTVSLGPPMVEMPLLLGLQEEQARSVLDSLGLVVGAVETRFLFGRDQGLVVEQEPPATTSLQRGSAVRIVVGRRGGGP